ncbi:TPA: hypothetical protein NM870_003595 [Acinetobacter baumannii]|nr:hypothetical protein [Acinetobacter baumannii]
MKLPNFQAIELPKRSVQYFMIIAEMVDDETDFQPIEYSKVKNLFNITEEEFYDGVLDIGALCTIDKEEFDIIHENWNHDSRKNNACLMLSNFIKNFAIESNIEDKGWKICFSSKNEPILKNLNNNTYFKVKNLSELSKEDMINFRADGYYPEYIPSYLRYKIPVAIRLLNKTTKEEEIKVLQLEYGSVEDYLALKNKNGSNQRMHNHLYCLFHYWITKPVPEWTEENKYELLDLWPISATDFNDYFPRN